MSGFADLDAMIKNKHLERGFDKPVVKKLVGPFASRFVIRIGPKKAFEYGKGDVSLHDAVEAMIDGVDSSDIIIRRVHESSFKIIVTTQ